MYSEDDLLPLSGLQHYVFCERQCALIHVEQVWAENVLTAEGRSLHERVDTMGLSERADVVVARAVPLVNRRLGLVGRADVVEYSKVLGEGTSCRVNECVALPGRVGTWHPKPVEYKRGKPKSGDCDRVQVCAQALCLEEMHGVRIPEAVLYYGRPRRRTVVKLDEPLRQRTVQAAAAYRALVASHCTPLVPMQPKCRRCSLLDVCKPPTRARPPSARRYVEHAIDAILSDEPVR